MFAGTRPGPTEISNGPSDWARECEVASVLSTHTRGNQFVNGIGHTGREDPGDTGQSARAHTCNSVNERDPWKTPASTWEIGRAPRCHGYQRSRRVLRFEVLPLRQHFCGAHGSISRQQFRMVRFHRPRCENLLESLRTLYRSGSLAMPRKGSTQAFSAEHRDVAVGIAGTFDIKNYGDLLFPLIAAAALKQRDRRIRVVPFSVNGKSEPSWPFQVQPMEQMIASISTLAAMLIGGGQIVRFDRYYAIPTPANVDLPFAYWLTPAVLAALIGKPVIWNAVGASMGWPHAPWYEELVRQVFAASYFIGVRDVVSRDDLAKVAPDAGIELLPDTAFGLSRLWPLEEESVEFTNWRMSLGLESNYVVIQANAAVGKYRSIIESLVASMGEINAVILPVCWCHGDRAEVFPELKGRVFLSREWLGPKLISEIIGRAEFVFASSLHACITALSYGVPAARVPISWGRKYELLDEFEGIAHIDKKEALSSLIHRRRLVEARVVEYADRLDRYWDEVTDVVLQPPMEHCNVSRTLMLCWLAKVCGDQGRLGLTRRWVETLRESLAGYFPNSRFVLSRSLSFLKNSVVTAFCWIARTKTPPIAEPRAEAEMPLIQDDGIGARKS